jgi:hypothetical protein
MKRILQKTKNWYRTFFEIELTSINQFQRKQKGQAALIMVVVILGVLLVIIASIGFLTYNDLKTINNSVTSSQSYYAAEGGIEDALLRIVNKMNYSTSYTLSVGAGSTDVNISGPLTNLIVTSKANVNNRFRKIEVGLGTTQSSTNISFNYGVQVGYGGLVMSNNAGINGNVYSNGPISGGNGSFVTGSAFSATGASPSADQANDSPTSPPNSINFRNVSSSQDFAQSFQVSADGPINKVQFYIRKTGTPSNATVRIVNNSAGNPGTTTFASGTLNASGVTGSYGWIDVTMSTSPQLNAGATYWVVIDNSTQSSSNYYTIGANTAYPNGQAKVGQQGGTWNSTSPAGLDGYFRVFLGGTSGSINNVNVGSGGVGNAYANTVTNSNIAGSLYCKTGSGNNKPCNTSLPDPTPQDFPITDANIAQFKAEAQAGTTYSGNYTLTNGATATIGPMVITGNMVLSNNVTLTMTGTVYVMGTITLSNNVTVRLDSGYGTNGGVLIADGFVDVTNGATFSGSGQAGSYMLVITTNDCNGVTSPTGMSCTGSNSAMNIGNNAGTVVMFAQKGQVDVGNNAGAKEITGYKLNLSNNAVVTYVTGLANANFSSGPGGGFQINSWKEVE